MFVDRINNMQSIVFVNPNTIQIINESKNNKFKYDPISNWVTQHNTYNSLINLVI